MSSSLLLFFAAFFFTAAIIFLARRLALQTRLLEQKEKELREARRQEALGTMAGGIAHDFNNILGSILGFGVLLEEDLATQPELQAMAGQITSAARRGQGIVAQLMSYSRRNMEQDHQVKMPVALDAVIQESLNLLQPCIRRSTRMRYDNKTDDSIIVGDSTQLSQAIVNLCINADHAIGVKTGSIGITLEKTDIDEKYGSDRPEIVEKMGNTVKIVNGTIAPGHYFRISVQDNGSGMTEDIARRIFDPFFTTKAVDEGTGLGLPAIQGIVHAHGGAIIVTTEHHRGTTFELLLPAAA